MVSRTAWARAEPTRAYMGPYGLIWVHMESRNPKKYAEKLVKLQPEYAQSYIGYLATFEKGKDIKSMKAKLMQLLPNFSPAMIRNFHSWIREDQADKIINSLRKHIS